MRNALRVAIVLAVVSTGCGGDSSTDSTPSDPSFLVDKQVSVGSNGGSAQVTFTTSSGQRIRITLVASVNTVQGLNIPGEPYGSLETPSHADAYHPTIETASSGQNVEELTLTETGLYKLTIFDGSGAGRSIHVTVQKIAS